MFNRHVGGGRTWPLRSEATDEHLHLSPKATTNQLLRWGFVSQLDRATPVKEADTVPETARTPPPGEQPACTLSYHPGWGAPWVQQAESRGDGSRAVPGGGPWRRPCPSFPLSPLTYPCSTGLATPCPPPAPHSSLLFLFSTPKVATNGEEDLRGEGDNAVPSKKERSVHPLPTLLLFIKLPRSPSLPETFHLGTKCTTSDKAQEA